MNHRVAIVLGARTACTEHVGVGVNAGMTRLGLAWVVFATCGGFAPRAPPLSFCGEVSVVRGACNT